MNNQEKENWPDFFIVGAPRCSTTALYEFLRGTLGVFLPKIKEINYFSQSTDKKYFLHAIRDKKKYLDLYKNTSDEIAIGDCSPSYLRDPLAPNLIHDVKPDAKIIMVLRNPIDRAFSHYLHLFTFGMIKTPFTEAIKDGMMSKDEYCTRIINSGLYFEQVKRYCDTFGLDQVQIFIFENLVKDIHMGIKKILNFLGVNNEPPNSITNVMYNKSVLPRNKLIETLLKNNTLVDIARKILPHSIKMKLSILVLGPEMKKPKMSPEDRKLLEEYYKNDIQKLENFLNKKMPWSMETQE